MARVRFENIGRAIHKSRSGYLVVMLKSKERIPRIGWRAFIEGKEVGVVSDIIGNVVKPYAVVKVKARELLDEIPEGALVAVHVPPPRRARRRARERGRRWRGKKMQRR